MLPQFLYHNAALPSPACQTRLVDAAKEAFLWFSGIQEIGPRGPLRKLVISEVGPMPGFLLEEMRLYLSSEDFLTPEEISILDEGGELLLLAQWERGDRSVGIKPGYVLDTAWNGDKPIHRTIEVDGNEVVSPGSHSLDQSLDQR